MAKNNDTPDWQKMLGYNQIDSTAKQKFLKEVMKETAADIAQMRAGAIADNMAQNITAAIREYFEKQKGSDDAFRMSIARAEGKIVIAALAKRFGSYQQAVELGLLLGVHKREDDSADGRSRLRHRFVWIADGTENPLVDITIDINGPLFDINHVSHVGELKL